MPCSRWARCPLRRRGRDLRRLLVHAAERPPGSDGGLAVRDERRADGARHEHLCYSGIQAASSGRSARRSAIGQPAPGDYAGWVFTAPPDTTISSYTLWRIRAHRSTPASDWSTTTSSPRASAVPCRRTRYFAEFCTPLGLVLGPRLGIGATRSPPRTGSQRSGLEIRRLNALMGCTSRDGAHRAATPGRDHGSVRDLLSPDRPLRSVRACLRARRPRLPRSHTDAPLEGEQTPQVRRDATGAAASSRSASSSTAHRVSSARRRSERLALPPAVHRARCPARSATDSDPRVRHRHPPQRPAHRPGLGHRRRRQRDAVGSRGGDDAQRVAAQRPWCEPVREARGVVAVAAEGEAAASAVVPYRVGADRRGAADGCGAGSRSPGRCSMSSASVERPGREGQAGGDGRRRATTGGSPTGSRAGRRGSCGSSTRPTRSILRRSRAPRSRSASAPASG